MSGNLRLYMRDTREVGQAVEIVLHDGPTVIHVFSINPKIACQWIALLAEGVEYSSNGKLRGPT